MGDINILAKDGFKPIGIALVLAIFFDFILGLGFIAGILYILAIALIFIYRNPERTVHSNQNEFLSPVDGKINSIDIKDGKTYLYIDVSLLDVHLLRSPIDADLRVESHIKGLNLPSHKFKAKKLNERAVLDFGKIKVDLLSGMCNPPMKLNDKKALSKGERFGIFVDGSVMIELANNEKLFVTIGDRVYSGDTVLGAFNS